MKKRIAIGALVGYAVRVTVALGKLEEERRKNRGFNPENQLSEIERAAISLRDAKTDGAADMAYRWLIRTIEARGL